MFCFLFTLALALVVLCSQSFPIDRRHESEELAQLRKHIQQQKLKNLRPPASAPVLNPARPEYNKPETLNTVAPTTVEPTGYSVLPPKSRAYPERSPILVAPTAGGTHWAIQLHNLSMYLSTKDGNSGQFTGIPKVHLMRVPKASSSSLSAVARRAVGCSPPGPCCRFPGVPAGSCPSKAMSQCEESRKVIGCTDHFPNLHYLAEARVPSISVMRNPFTRSLSGFFYPGIHHNSNCKKDLDTCFQEYASDTRWTNIVVKMLVGLYPYSDVKTCATDTECRPSAQLATRNLNLFTFMGVAEMWEMSLLVFHRKFPTIAPDLSEFKMATEENSVTKGSRVNMKEGYSEFKHTALVKYAAELHAQNGLDAALYRVVVSNLCEDLHVMGLWNHSIVSAYWAETSPFKTEKCP